MKTNKRFLNLQNLTGKLPVWMLTSYSETHRVICSHVKLETIPWTLQIQSYSESCKNHVSNVSLGAWSKPEFFSLITWFCVLQNTPSFSPSSPRAGKVSHPPAGMGTAPQNWVCTVPCSYSAPSESGSCVQRQPQAKRHPPLLLWACRGDSRGRKQLILEQRRRHRVGKE